MTGPASAVPPFIEAHPRHCGTSATEIGPGTMTPPVSVPPPISSRIQPGAPQLITEQEARALADQELVSTPVETTLGLFTPVGSARVESTRCKLFLLQFQPECELQFQPRCKQGDV